MALNAQKIFDFILRAVKELSSSSSKTTGNSTPAGKSSTARRSTPHPAATTRNTGTQSEHPASAYPGDFHGKLNFEYSPNLDGNADPGEVVWGWVPYEEDHAQGKDRPVLIVGRDGDWLLGLMLTSKDKNNSQHRNANYLDVGIGSWDREGRPSEVKLDRVIRLSQSAVRREGAIFDRERFMNVANALSNGR